MLNVKRKLKTLASVVAMVRNEMLLLNKIRLALQEQNCITFRCNVGKVKMADGRWFDTGLPSGFSDLLAIRKDGKACFIEVKDGNNKPSEKQCNFLIAMIKSGCAAGVAYSTEDAIKIVNWTPECAEISETLIRNYLKGAKTK